MMKRFGLWLGFVLAMSCFVAAALDYVGYVYKQHRGTAVSYVTVRQYLATPLKNGRDELDFLGETDEPCVRTMLPHQKMAPCWWIRQHKDHWIQS
jgi:hypothetical protein